MAKIAVDFELTATRLTNDRVTERPESRVLARGPGWGVSEVICNAGPRDRSFEEQHRDVCIAIVMAGSFQYASSAGRELMTPGSILLGNPGQYFECGHEHGVGDRCISFAYKPSYFESLATEASVQSRGARFSSLRVPPVRELSRLVTRVCAGLAESRERSPGQKLNASTTEVQNHARNSSDLAGDSHVGMVAWEEISIELAARVLEIATGNPPNLRNFPAAEARVTRIVRMIESRPEAQHGLIALTREAKLSRYHFLRIFQELTGLTPHQYVLRARLRQAATRLVLEPARVLDIALDSGFGDVSNFNHAFRAEFGTSPLLYRNNERRSAKGK